MKREKIKKSISLTILVVSTIGWPVSQLTFAKHEPPFILGLSWFAIWLESMNSFFINDTPAVKEEVEE